MRITAYSLYRTADLQENFRRKASPSFPYIKYQPDCTRLYTMFRRRCRVNPHEATDGSGASTQVTESSPQIGDIAEYNSEEEWVDLGSTGDPSQQIPDDSRKLAAEGSGSLSIGSIQLLEAIRIRERIQAVVSNPRSCDEDR